MDLRRTRAQGRCPRPHKALIAPEHGPGLPMAAEKELHHRVAPPPFAERKGNLSGKSFPADAGCGHLPCARVKHELSIDEKLGGGTLPPAQRPLPKISYPRWNRMEIQFGEHLKNDLPQRAQRKVKIN